jgi:hypothetical protein
MLMRMNICSETMAKPNSPSAGSVAPRATRPSATAPIAARTKLVPGPAAATAIIPSRGLSSRCFFTGTGLAQPNTGAPASASRPGRITVPNGSTWRMGLSERRRCSFAVGSPSASAAQPCATS